MLGHAANQDDVPDYGSDLRNRAIESRIDQRLTGTSTTIDIHLRSIHFSVHASQLCNQSRSEMSVDDGT